MRSVFLGAHNGVKFIENQSAEKIPPSNVACLSWSTVYWEI